MDQLISNDISQVQLMSIWELFQGVYKMELTQLFLLFYLFTYVLTSLELLFSTYECNLYIFISFNMMSS